MEGEGVSTKDITIEGDTEAEENTGAEGTGGVTTKGTEGSTGEVEVNTIEKRAEENTKGKRVG